MDHLHWEGWLDANQCVKVDCDTRCNVLLMEDSDYRAYLRGDSHDYYGGWYEEFPVILLAPRMGRWNVVLDVDGAQALVRHSITVMTLPDD